MGDSTYVERGGELVFPPPFIAEGVQFFGFMVDADAERLQAICDKYLNGPAGVQDFRPVTRQVLFVFNRMDRMYAEQHPWRERGEFREEEAAVWMLVWDQRRRKLHWFHPFMIVDGVHTLVTGREIYGFPKTLGTFEMCVDPAAQEPGAPPLSLEVKTAVVERFGGDAPVRARSLITVRATKGANDMGSKPFASLEALAEGILGAAGLIAPMNADLLLPHTLDALRNARIPDFVFLKQFRDGSRTSGAVAQSIELAPVEMTRFHGAHLYTPGTAYEIVLGDHDSHDIRCELGLPGGAIPVRVAFWAKFDFRVGACAQLHAPRPAKKRKVLILGGGIGAVTTAIRLTNDDDWRDRFESITLYQMGWRLGGKGATGRGKHHTIEEHGLHVWLGFYENAFQTIRDIHRTLGSDGVPLSELGPGFTCHHDVGVNELVKGRWEPWMFPFPPREGEPGSTDARSELEPLRTGYARIITWLRSQILDELRPDEWAPELAPALAPLAPLGPVLNDVAGLIADPANDDDVIEKLESVTDAVSRLLNSVPVDDIPLNLRRAALLMLMGSAVVGGLLRCRVFSYDDLARLEDVDISAWLRQQVDLPHLWDPSRNALLRGLYDFAFAYKGGDVNAYDFAAGPALRTVLRMCLTYKGAVFFKMNAGMGDTIFAPAYAALRKRGVDVKFFHKVTNLGLSADKRRIRAIEMEVQATLRPEYTTYDPLIDVPCGGGAKGSVPGWPNCPKYNMLEEGTELAQHGIDLESFWTGWEGSKCTVTVDEHDVVVLGISVGALPFLSRELAEASPKWRMMLEKSATVSTQALQVWTTRTLPELGWHGPAPVIDAWVQPLNTWADLSVVRRFECAPAGAEPGSIAYFCGPRKDGAVAIPERDRHDFPAEALAEVKVTAERMLAKEIGTLWRALKGQGLPEHERVHTYYRANVNPSDRYVLSLAGSSAHRLAANESGFDNLVLTGDWIRNGYNAGCVESATWSGFQAANAILGQPLDDGVIS